MKLLKNLSISICFIMLLNFSIVINAVETQNSANTEFHSLGWNPEPQEVLDSIPEVLSIYPRSGLPSALDLSSAFPTPKDQGQQLSCTAWAVAYALKTYQEKAERQWDISITNNQFSPSYIYNQINNGVDNGSSIYDAVKLVTEQGVCTLSDMQYYENNYWSQPNTTQRERAAKYKALSFAAVKNGNAEEMKIQLSKNIPIVIGIPIYNDFDNLDTYNPIYNVKDYNYRGDHAVCLVGYDDAKSAFKFINSWGTDWGLGGFGYISYDFIKNDNTYGYIMYDKIDATSISLGQNYLELKVDEIKTLSATILPNNASIKTLAWSSSNPSIATVDSNGTIRAISRGNTVITATNVDNNISSSCNVAVASDSDSLTDITFQYSTDFSTVQGNKGWYYMDKSGSSYNLMTWNASSDVWKGTYTYNQMHQNWIHPDKNDTVIKWVAPATGRIEVSCNGLISRVGQVGDGVRVRLLHNSNQLWQYYIPLGGSAQFNSMTLDVKFGDSLYFEVNMQSSTYTDTTTWDPVIKYTYIPLTLNDYQYSADFSTVQGHKGWYYMDKSGSSYNLMTWNASSNVWKGTYTYNQMHENWIHPDKNDTVIKWVAPKAGNISVSCNGPITRVGTYGDGVKVKFLHNSNLLWQSNIPLGGNTQFNAMTLNVKAGDALYFEVNMLSSTHTDTTTWDPIINYI